MVRTLRLGWICVLLGALLPLPARAGVTMRGWYFPAPFTMHSPTSPHRFGGLDFSLAVGDGGYAIAFPLQSTLTDAANRFIIDLSFPLAVGVPDQGATEFYGGSPKIGMRGNWRFDFPFSGGYHLPAAWAVGGELDVPLAMIWKGNNGFGLGFPMYLHDPVTWLPAFTFRPVAQFAIGKPLFFLELELSLPNSVSTGGDYSFLLGWGATLGSQPDDLVSITLELGGLHDLTGLLFPASADAVWGALGARLYLGQFVTGLALRLPFTKAYGPLDPTISFTVFVGYEQRHRDMF